MSGRPNSGGGRVLALAAAAVLVGLAASIAGNARRAGLRNELVRQAIEAEISAVRARLAAWDELDRQPPPSRRPGWTVFPWEYSYSPAAADLIAARRMPAGPAAAAAWAEDDREDLHP